MRIYPPIPLRWQFSKWTDTLVRTTAAAVLHGRQPRQISFTATCQHLFGTWAVLCLNQLSAQARTPRAQTPPPPLPADARTSAKTQTTPGNHNPLP